MQGPLPHGPPILPLELVSEAGVPAGPLQGSYDEEVEVYRHHLEQVYKLCRPCQAAVEHYLKHQNRQLRALLLSHQFQRRDADRSRMQVRGGSAVGRMPSPASLAGTLSPTSR